MTAGWSTDCLSSLRSRRSGDRRSAVLEERKLRFSFPNHAAPTRENRFDSQTRLDSSCGALRGNTARAGQKGGGAPRGWAGEGGGFLAKPPQDWSVPGISVFAHKGRAQGGRCPTPASPRRLRSTKPAARSAPWNPGRAMAAAAAPPSRSANGRACCRGAGPAPERTGLGSPGWRSGRDRRRAVRAGGPREGLSRVQTLQGGPAKDGASEKVRSRNRACWPPEAAAGRLGPRAELGVFPGGDRVTAWRAAPGMAEGRPGPRLPSGGAQRGAAARRGRTAKSPK